MSRASVGLIGCGVMGQNLALNLESKGFSVRVYDADQDKLAEYLRVRAAGKGIWGASGAAELAGAVERPRRILIMVPAGEAVDACIERLLEHLEPGDVLVDGGNSHYADTNRRSEWVEARGVGYIGAGISGGAEGALRGPSIMPGGSRAAWERVRPVLQAIAARSEDGSLCCEWVGPGGAGHFVKMVHNGIEYGEMQLICEAYHVMREGFGMSPDEISDVLDKWNQGELSSFLLEVTRDVLRHRDEDGEPLVEKMLDAAQQKGTGRWAVLTALELGQPLTVIGEAVFARYLSALKGEREVAAGVHAGPGTRLAGDEQAIADDLRRAMYASKIVCFAQGFQLMRTAATEYEWELNYGGIAQLWRGGCIIRSLLLGRIQEAFTLQPDLVNLLLDPGLAAAVGEAQAGWRRAVTRAVDAGIPLPVTSGALAYFDGYRRENLPANLLQAQRDYFGAHGYQRIDRPRGESFHTDWARGQSEA